jgi:hypothetical protein
MADYGTTNLRGSQKLLQGLAKNGEVPSIEEIKRALDLPQDATIRIPNWLTRGTPPAYLQLDATITTPVAQIGTIVNKFVALNDSTIGLKILINGVPLPELATIIVSNTPEEN